LLHPWLDAVKKRIQKRGTQKRGVQKNEEEQIKLLPQAQLQN
jgi:hypothetical protein